MAIIEGTLRVSIFSLPPMQPRQLADTDRDADMGPGPAAGFEVAGYLDEWAARIDKKIHQEGGQIRLSSLGGIKLPVVLRGRVAFAEALEQCGFQRAGGPGPLGIVKTRSLAARADRPLTMPSGGSKQRQRRAATSLPASAATRTLSSLSSAVNKRARPADRARPPAGQGQAGKAGSAHFRLPHLDTKEAERRQQRTSRFEMSSRFEMPSRVPQRSPPTWQEQLRQSQPPPLTLAALKELAPKTAGHVRYLHTLQVTLTCRTLTCT